jgi:hypothetical protein
LEACANARLHLAESAFLVWRFASDGFQGINYFP